MNEREALKLALEALEFYYDLYKEKVDANVITAIKEALAQPEQEPDDLTIAYMTGFHAGKNKDAPQGEWVGLDDEDMKEKIHDLKTALNVLRIQQTVSFDDCQKLMTDVHDKTGFTPPNFEISGNQWCVLVNLAVARFGNTTPPQSKPLLDEMVKQMKENCDSMEMRGAFANGWLSAEAAHGIKGE